MESGEVIQIKSGHIYMYTQPGEMHLYIYSHSLLNHG